MLGSTVGMTGHVFQVSGFCLTGLAACGVAVDAETTVLVGTTVINGLGVREGSAEFAITASRSLVGATVIRGVEGAAQAVRRTRTNKWETRFIVLSISTNN